jgi:hypothetical protein
MVGKNSFLAFVAFFVALSCILSSSAYATDITACGSLGSGTNYLKNDILNSAQMSCFNVPNDNVVLDCQGHIIEGQNVTTSIGIEPLDDFDITIMNCTIRNWHYGIYAVYPTSDDLFKDNRIYGNRVGIGLGNGWEESREGMYGLYSSDVYNNFFNNTVNIELIDGGPNDANNWNTSLQLGTRIYGNGLYTGGNYWTSPNGSGFAETCVDAAKDGICDTSFTILGSNNVDFLPLSDEFVTTPPVIPTWFDEAYSFRNAINFTPDSVTCNAYSVNDTFGIYGETYWALLCGDGNFSYSTNQFSGNILIADESSQAYWVKESTGAGFNPMLMYDNGTTAVYRMDNVSFPDSTRYKNDMISTNITSAAISESHGLFGGGTYFDDNNVDYVKIPAKLVNVPVGSVSVWLNSTKNWSTNYWVPIGDSLGEFEIMYNTAAGNAVHFYVDGTDLFVIDRNVFKNNDWTFVVLSWNAVTDSHTLFVYGSSPVSYTSSVAIGTPAATNLYLGYYSGAGNTSDRAFRGEMDEVRFYNRSVGQAEANYMYYNGINNLTSLEEGEPIRASVNITGPVDGAFFEQTSKTIALNYVNDSRAVSAWYSLTFGNNETGVVNATLTGNTSITGYYGLNKLTVYVNASSGSVASDYVEFQIFNCSVIPDNGTIYLNRDWANCAFSIGSDAYANGNGYNVSTADFNGVRGIIENVTATDGFGLTGSTNLYRKCILYTWLGGSTYMGIGTGSSDNFFGGSTIYGGFSSSSAETYFSVNDVIIHGEQLDPSIYFSASAVNEYFFMYNTTLYGNVWTKDGGGAYSGSKIYGLGRVWCWRWGSRTSGFSDTQFYDCEKALYAGNQNNIYQRLFVNTTRMSTGYGSYDHFTDIILGSKNVLLTESLGNALYWSNVTQDGKDVLLRVTNPCCYKNCDNIDGGSYGQVLLGPSCSANVDDRNFIAKTLVMSEACDKDITNVTLQYMFLNWLTGCTYVNINNTVVSNHINITGISGDTFPLNLINVTTPEINVFSMSSYYRKWNVFYNVAGSPSSIVLKNVTGDIVYAPAQSSGSTVQTEYYATSSARAYSQPYTLRAAKTGYMSNSSTFNFSSDAHISLSMDAPIAFVGPTPANDTTVESNSVYVNVTAGGANITACTLNWRYLNPTTVNAQSMSIDPSGAFCYYNLTVTKSPLYFNVTVNVSAESGTSENRQVYPFFCGVDDQGYSKWSLTKDYNCTSTVTMRSYSDFNGNGHYLDSSVHSVTLYALGYLGASEIRYMRIYNITIYNGIDMLSDFYSGTDDGYGLLNMTYYTYGHGTGRDRIGANSWNYPVMQNVFVYGCFYDYGASNLKTKIQNVTIDGSTCSVVYAIQYGSSQWLKIDSSNLIGMVESAGVVTFTSSVFNGKGTAFCTSLGASYSTVTLSGNRFLNCTTAIKTTTNIMNVDSSYIDTPFGVDYFDAGTLTNNRFGAANILATGSNFDSGCALNSFPVNNTQDGYAHPVVIRADVGSAYVNCTSVNPSITGVNPAQVLVFYGCPSQEIRDVRTRTVLTHRNNVSVTNVTMDYFISTGKWALVPARDSLLNNSVINIMANLTQTQNLTFLNTTVPLINNIANGSSYFVKYNAIYTVYAGGVPTAVTVEMRDRFGSLVYSRIAASDISPQTMYYDLNGIDTYYQPYTISATNVPFGYYPTSMAFNFSSDVLLNLSLPSYDKLVYNGQSIQNAINLVSDGAVIGIYNGTYPESVIVNKSVTLICQFVNSTWINGGFNVVSPNVVIQNCNISGGINSSYNSYGIIAASTGGLFTDNHVRSVVASVASEGKMGAAFYITGSGNNVSNNRISDVAGGGIDSALAKIGGIGAGVYVASSGNLISGNTFTNMTGGEGGRYRAQGGGGNGGVGSAVYLASSANGNTVLSNNMTNVSGGLGGYGVVYAGSGSRTGGTGGVGAGVFIANTVSGNIVQKNVMSSVRGGYAGVGGLQVGDAVYSSYNQSGYGIYFEPSYLSAVDSESVQAPTDNDLGVSASDFNAIDGDYIVYLYGKSGIVISGLSLASAASPTNLGKIAIVNSVNVNVTGNTFRHMNGLSANTNPSYNGSGFHGTHGAGIFLWNATACNVSSNVVSNVTGGNGASGGDYGLASSGMDAYGIYLGGASVNNIVQKNAISSLRGGLLGNAADYTAKDGSNGTAFGIFLEGDSMANDLGSGISAFNTQESDYIVYLYGKSGLSVTGLTLTSAASATNYGKVALIYTNNTDVKGNMIASYVGESGDMASSYGGVGSFGAGVYMFGCIGDNVSSNEIYNIDGGLGGPTNQNAHGGTGGISAGILLSSSDTNFVGYNSVHDVRGGRGGSAHNDGLTYKGDGGAGAAVFLIGSTGNTILSNGIGLVSGGLQGYDGISAGITGIAYKIYPKPITALEPNTAGQLMMNGVTYYINWTRGDNDYGDYQLYWSTVQGAAQALIDPSVTEVEASCDSDLSCAYAWVISGVPSGTFIFTYANESNNASAYSSFAAYMSSLPDQPTNEHPYNNSGSLLPITLMVTVTHPDNSTMNVSFYNASGNSLIGTASSVPSGGVAQVSWVDSFILFKNYTWYVNITDGIYTVQSGVYQFMVDDPPMALDMHVTDRGTDHLVFAWNNAPDNAWVSLKVQEQTETLRTAVSASDNWTADHELLKWNTVYNFTHYAGDDFGLIGPEASFLVRTDGWLDDYDTFMKKRLVTVDGVTASDLDVYAVNVTLTDENFVFGNLGNPDDGSDIRFGNYYETEPLNYTLQYYNVTHAGGTESQLIPNYTACYGNWLDCNKTYDGDMNTFGAPFVGENASVYFNFTKPSMVKSSSKVTVKDGDGYGWQMDIPFACFSGGSQLRFRALADYNARSVTWQCQQYSDDSWYTLRAVDNYYHVYHIEVLWAYQADAWFTVYLDHLDANYSTTFYIYYGKVGASSESQSLSYAGVWQDTTVGSEIILEYPTVQLYNLTVEAVNSTAFNATWFDVPASDNWLRYSLNPYFIGEWLSGYDNATTTPVITVSDLATDAVYYVRAMACSSGQLVPSCGYSDSNVTLGTPPSVPTISILNYTEDRPNKQVTVCADLSDTDSQTVSMYVQYWELDTSNEFFNESSRVTGIVAPAVRCFTLPVVYGKIFMYRAVANGSSSTGYSSAYMNEFRAPETCFAGNPVTDDDDQRERACSGYREGSCQRETFMYIETNITGSGALMVKWWDGSSWSFIPMNSTADMYYLDIENLNNNATWYTFEIWNSTAMVVNWTKPSLSHPENMPNQNERKYVSFGCTAQPLEYKVMYMRGFQKFVVPVYRWCIASGGGVYDCMMAEYYGGGRESFLGADRTGTLYDAGELLRGGIWDGEAFDTGTLDPVRGDHSFDLNHVMLPNNTLVHQGQPVPNFNVDSPDGTSEYRYCFAFLNFWWNESFVPSNGIRNYYAHYWHSDAWWSVYFWHEQPYHFDYDSLFKWQYDLNSMTRDFHAQPSTIQDVQNDVQHVSDIDLFNSSYPQSLAIYQKSFPEMAFDGDDSIYDFGFHMDATWTNVMMGKHQQAFVIFNLPDNATLQGMDSDSDGLTDFDELYVYYTNPFSADTDEGGVPDGIEVSVLHTDPNIYADDDLIPPTLDVYYPVNGTIYHVGNVSIFGVASDAHLDSVFVNDSRFNNTGNKTDFSFMAAGLPDGIYDVRVTVNDTGMNVKSVDVLFRIDSSPPVIYDVSVQPTATPLEDSVVYVSVNFSADDVTGVTGAVHYGKLLMGSESAINSSCLNYNLSATARRFECVLPMQYYYAAGIWAAELQACDLGLLCNTSIISSMIYNELKAWVSDTDTISFGGYRLSNSAIFPDYVTLRNTGNVNNTNITLTAYNLVGVEDPSYVLPADGEVFKVGPVANWGVVTGLLNGVAVKIDGTYLDRRGPSTGLLTLYFGINPSALPPETAKQVYHNAFGQEWYLSS